MTWCLAEAEQDAFETEHGYEQEVRCIQCGEGFIRRFWEGEPVNESSMTCPCGGAMEAI
jgi:hypothetical protein